MYLYNLDDIQTRKLVTFYCGFTSVYFPALLCLLYYTNYLYSSGKYSFYPVLGVVLVAEYIKYLIGNSHFPRTQGTRYEVHTSSKRNSITSRIKEVLKSFIISFSMCYVYYAIIILFGAQVFSKYEETVMLSALLCTLTVLPICLISGANSVISLLLGIKMSGDLIREYLYCNCRFTFFGTWLGAFVIPLDWDRPWQVWPIPCVTGAMLGFMCGNFVTLLRLFPKIIQTYYSKSAKRN